VPESNMPSYQWLFDAKLTGDNTADKMAALNVVISATCSKCNTYTEDDMKNAKAAVEGKTEAQALVHYLQGLGTAL
jgi:cytochrome c oxidase cbb3-type subunit 2